jgi:predicted MPP superfamily phosphohydrolase
MAASRVITWLHLSDLHFQAGQKWEQAVVLKALLRDVLADLPGRHLQPDFVFVTGDIANSGQQAEYAEAGRFFAEVARITATDPKTSWFLVPGNHDVNCAQIKPLARISASAVQDTAQVNAILTDGESRTLFTSRERAFFEFTSSFLGEARAWSDLAPWTAESREVNGLRVAILGLNSAWSAEGGDQDQGRLLLGEFQVREAIAAADAHSPTLKIALMHHPLDWMRSFDQELIKSLLFGKGGVHLLLRGHLHKGRISRQDNPDSNCIELAAGALWQDATYPHGVTVVRLDADAGLCEVYLYRYSSEGRGFWKPDNFLYENVNEGHWVFKLPKSWGINQAGAAGDFSLAPSAENAEVLGPTPSPLGVRCNVEWDRSSYRAGTDLCRALVTVQIDEPKRPPQQPATDMRTPVHHILVLDISGSMNAPNKYPVLAEAVDVYLRTLSPTDIVSLIPFSSVAEVLLSSWSVTRLRRRGGNASGLLSSWPHRFEGTVMAPALSLAQEEIDRAREGGFEGVVRLLCLTDGQLQDYLACRPLAQDLRERGASMSMFGFGEDFDATSAEALAAEADGTVRYVQAAGTELEEYFGHMARTSQRIVVRNASVSLHLGEGVTCFNVFSCRPQERHVGRFDHDASDVVTHQMGALRYGTPYMLLYELRAWEAQTSIAELQFGALSADGPVRLARQLRPTFGPVTGAPNDFVQKMANSVGALIRNDSETQITALEARITLYKREGRAPQHIASLERQLEVIRRGGSISELSADDQHFARADASTKTLGTMVVSDRRSPTKVSASPDDSDENRRRRR